MKYIEEVLKKINIVLVCGGAEGIETLDFNLEKVEYFLNKTYLCIF